MRQRPRADGRALWVNGMTLSLCYDATVFQFTSTVERNARLTYVRNRGELAEGWYDPSTLQKAIDAESNPEPAREKEPTPRNEDDSDDDDELGPAPPGQQHKSRQQRLGPSIPNLQDLELKRELDAEDSNARREDLRYERKIDRKEQKDRLDELVPRAEAGTRERKLEKKAEVNAKMKSFREKSPGAAVEVPESELMGGGDGLAEFKKQKEEFERKKNDREIRREELLRARAEEREERLREYREKEDKTMAMLQEIAKQRFG